MDLAIAIILALAALILKYMKIGDWFSPWMITLVIWSAIMFLVPLHAEILYPLSDQFYISLALWVPIICVSSILTYSLMPRASGKDVHLREMHLNKAIFTVLYVISMIITPLYLYQIMQIVTMFDTTDMLYNIRVYAVYGDNTFGFLNYSFVINQSLLVVAIWHYPKIPKWQLITIYLANVLSCFAIMEKGGVFYMVSTTLFVLFEKRIIKTRSIVITILVIIGLFFLMNSTRELQSEDVDSMTFVDFFAIYVVSPAVAFGKVAVDISDQVGSHTLEVIYLFLERFGMDIEVHNKLQVFVWVPLPTNVYTIFQPFYQDFGYVGVAFFALIYGFLSGLIYRHYRNGSGFCRCLYAYFVYALILQFYQENIFLSMVFVIQMMFFLYLMLQDKIKLSFKSSSL